jgi:cold-inducible RNA-binding protein
MNIYVGNLSYDTQNQDLEDAFAQYGSVTSARVMSDRETGRSRGFGFVEMSSDDEARNAINKLNGTALQGRNINVNEARPRTERAPRSNYGSSRY